jgi:hypothetical protein
LDCKLFGSFVCRWMFWGWNQLGAWWVTVNVFIRFGVWLHKPLWFSFAYQCICGSRDCYPYHVSTSFLATGSCFLSTSLSYIIMPACKLSYTAPLLCDPVKLMLLWMNNQGSGLGSSNFCCQLWWKSCKNDLEMVNAVLYLCTLL